jgi:hypothetical protein
MSEFDPLRGGQVSCYSVLYGDTTEVSAMSCLGDVFCHHPLCRLVQTSVFLAFFLLRLSSPVDIYLASHAHGIRYSLRTSNSSWPEINIRFSLWDMNHSAVLTASGRQNC